MVCVCRQVNARWHLPVEDMKKLIIIVRRIARLEWTLFCDFGARPTHYMHCTHFTGPLRLPCLRTVSLAQASVSRMHPEHLTTNLTITHLPAMLPKFCKDLPASCPTPLHAQPFPCP